MVYFYGVVFYLRVSFDERGVCVKYGMGYPGPRVPVRMVRNYNGYKIWFKSWEFEVKD